MQSKEMDKRQKRDCKKRESGTDWYHMYSAMILSVVSERSKLMRSDKRDMFAARRRINKELDGEGVLLSDSMNLERKTAL